MKRILIFLILFSMMLHCASRLGILSHLYKNRHEIAHTFGLIKEVPIAICSESDFANGASLLLPDHQDQSAPIFSHAPEINLFCVEGDQFETRSTSAFHRKGSTPFVLASYATDLRQIFHPPLIG